MKPSVPIALVVALVLGGGVFIYTHVHEASTPVTPVATTTEPIAHCDNDAKLCPDGSTVLRTGAQCEFAECPSMFGEVREWQNRKDPKSNISFKYPVTLGSQYVTARDWPPTVTNTGKNFTCELAEGTKAMSGYSAKEETYNDTSYCVWQKAEGAAGSTYTEYQVTVPKNDTHLTFHFTVQTPQCMNYDGSEQSMCQAAQRAFSVLELVSGMTATISL